MTMNMHLENAPTAPRAARKAAVIPAEPGWRVTCCDEGGIDEDGNPPVDQTFPVSAWLDDGDRLVPMIFDPAERGLMVVRSPNFGRILALTPPGRTESVAEVNGRVSGGVAQSPLGEGTNRATDAENHAADLGAHGHDAVAAMLDPAVEQRPTDDDDDGDTPSLEGYLHAHDVLREIGHEEVAQWIWDAVLTPACDAAKAISEMINGHYAEGIIPKREELSSEVPAMPSYETIDRAIKVLTGEVQRESRATESQDLLAEVLLWLIVKAAEMEIAMMRQCEPQNGSER